MMGLMIICGKNIRNEKNSLKFRECFNKWFFVHESFKKKKKKG